MIAFYDTETTGLPLYGRRSSDPDQPHLVSVAVILVDDHFNIVDTYEGVVRPMGWVVPWDSIRIHGITNDIAEQIGYPEEHVLREAVQMINRAKVRIGYNEPFDARIVRIGLWRYQSNLLDWWESFPAECAMRLMQSAFSGKIQTLSAAYHAVTGRPLKNAHNCMADASACMRIFKSLATGNVAERKKAKGASFV